MYKKEHGGKLLFFINYIIQNDKIISDFELILFKFKFRLFVHYFYTLTNHVYANFNYLNISSSLHVFICIKSLKVCFYLNYYKIKYNYTSV